MQNVGNAGNVRSFSYDVTITFVTFTHSNTLNMQNPRLASRYAKSLLDLAVEQNALDATLQDMTLLDAVSRSSRDFSSMLRSPIIKADKKQAIFDAVLGSRLTPLIKSFVTLLVKKGREGNLPEIAVAFIGQYKELKKIKTVRLITAGPVSDTFKEAIRAKVAANMPDSHIELHTSVDESLIGGFVLEMDDKIVDASVRRDLNDIRSQFTQNIYVSHFN